MTPLTTILKSLAERKFDPDTSVARMPRLYEHIDRVDLWPQAQEQQHTQDQKLIVKLVAALAEAEEFRLTIENNGEGRGMGWTPAQHARITKGRILEILTEGEEE